MIYNNTKNKPAVLCSNRTLTIVEASEGYIAHNGRGVVFDLYDYFYGPYVIVRLQNGHGFEICHFVKVEDNRVIVRDKHGVTYSAGLYRNNDAIIFNATSKDVIKGISKTENDCPVLKALNFSTSLTLEDLILVLRFIMTIPNDYQYHTLFMMVSSMGKEAAMQHIRFHTLLNMHEELLLKFEASEK